MTNHAGRLYGLALAVLVFFVLWAAIAAHPWVSAAADPRIAALAAREQQLRHDAVLVKQIVARRNAVYRLELAQRNAAIKARTLSATTSQAVRVVNLPPLTITRTS